MYQENNYEEDNYFSPQCNYPKFEPCEKIYDNDADIFFESEFGYMTMMENGDDKFKGGIIDLIQEEGKRKYYSEINPISRVKTKASESSTQKDEEKSKHLGKKREIENEKLEDEKEEDTKSVGKGDDKKKIIGDIFEIYKEFNKRKTKDKKKKERGKHDKYANDNIVRKIKSKLFNSILIFINSSMIEVEIENPKKNSKKKLFTKPFFLKIEQEIIANINIDFNLNLLNSQLKDIFSYDTSKKVEKNFGSDKNRKLVEKIYEEKIQKKVIEILNMTLYQCMEHFRGTKFYEELSGLEKEYKIVIKELEQKEKEDDEDEVEGEVKEDYIEKFKDLLNTFKEYYENKKKRKPKRKEKTKNLFD